MLSKSRAIEILESEYGQNIEQLMATAMFDSVSPAVCMNCGATYEYEPDCTKGRCDSCETNNVEALLFLVW